jgi:hypothetical protein
MPTPGTTELDPALLLWTADLVRLELGIHGCIETTARRVRQALVDAYLAERLPAMAAEGAIELLTDLLDQTDFRSLRSSAPELDGRVRVGVEVARLFDGRVVCRKA